VTEVPQWRTAFETAGVIMGVDVTSGREILVFSRGAHVVITGMGTSDEPHVLRVSIDCTGEDLELLTAACEIVRGHQDYETVDE
jgi:hypothetical protein